MYKKKKNNSKMIINFRIYLGIYRDENMDNHEQYKIRIVIQI